MITRAANSEDVRDQWLRRAPPPSPIPHNPPIQFPSRQDWRRNAQRHYDSTRLIIGAKMGLFSHTFDLFFSTVIISQSLYRYGASVSALIRASCYSLRCLSYVCIHLSSKVVEPN